MSFLGIDEIPEIPFLVLDYLDLYVTVGMMVSNQDAFRREDLDIHIRRESLFLEFRHRFTADEGYDFGFRSLHGDQVVAVRFRLEYQIVKEKIAQKHNKQNYECSTEQREQGVCLDFHRETS